MSSNTEIVFLVSMFILRLGVPLAITLLAAYGLRKLDERWQAEAEARQALTVQTSRPTLQFSPNVHCWEKRGCSEETRRRCPAYQQSALPCWMARLRADNRVPGGCYGCTLFQPKLVLHQQAM